MDIEKCEPLAATLIANPGDSMGTKFAEKPICSGRIPARVFGLRTAVAAPVALGLIVAIVIAGVVGGVISNRLHVVKPASRGDECAWGSYRLPDTISAVHYDLVWNLTRAFELSPTFEGSVAIGLTLATVSPPVRCVLVHTRGLSVTRVTVEATGVPPVAAIFMPDPFPASDRIIVRLPGSAVGLPAVALRLNFSGNASAAAEGLYATSYVNGSAVVRLVSTKFEPSLARTAFPCLDEPALKATFGITLQGVPAGFLALANMPALGDAVAGAVSFETSPVMSTCERG